MKHFLITRFNIPFEKFSQDKAGKEILDAEWLSHRFNLFEKICFPSVQNQSEKGFIWMIYFDINTPNVYKDRIEKLKSNFRNINPYYVQDMDDFYTSLNQDISFFLSDNDSYLITSRMDNDDLIHRDFIKTIQSLAQEKNKYLIDLSRGYQMNLDGKVDKVIKQFNPFISLKESVDSFETVMAHQHGRWRGKVSRKRYKKKLLWVQIIHDKNLHNHFKKRFFFQKKIDLVDFGVPSLKEILC